MQVTMGQQNDTTSNNQVFQETFLPILAGWMGFEYLSPQTEQLMPPFLSQMVKLSNKPQRKEVFSQETSRFLRNNPDLCTGFQFPQGLASELNKIEFDMPDLATDWHKGLGPGVAMRRDRAAVNAHKRMHDSVGDWGGQFQFRNSDRQKLETPTPTPPQNFAEFLPFLRRYQKICQDWLGFSSHRTQTVTST